MAVAPPAAGLTERARRHPEWRPWLAVLEAVNAAAREPVWRNVVPPPASGGERVPALAGATVTVDARLLRRWLRRLLQTAAASGGPAATLAAAARADVERLRALLEGGLEQDSGRVAEVAAALGADAGPLSAVAAVAPVPLLRACATRWADRLPATWDQGGCPVCGAWPTLAEARGLERARRLRCGRCAADWRTQWLRCPFCAATDHTRLGSLVLTVEVPDGAAAGLARVATSIDTCQVCRGYLKTVTTLTPTSADDLALLDLATVELDVAAIEHGYARPAGPALPLGARVAASGAGGLAGWWRS